ncbi:hypothetical protein H4R18_004535 [Coemansia javaensis]|uniref:Uncharacterized protein n=1 Tax=Coemansia javaensis TaxID=2761396 RepID=A0A9W8H953_9FUNG|nr:hypothetical protein H4R18_004535 [Coemansia javaensis]
MTGAQAFPRLRQSPGGSASGAAAPPDLRTFGCDGGYRSLPHTPRAYYPGPRSIWAAMRRDRQSRIHAILGAHSAKDAQSAHAASHRSRQQPYHAGSVVEGLSPRELPRAIRLRAREVGWMLGQRSRPRQVLLSDMANALRTTALDEDDAVTDALEAAERLGYAPDAAQQSADFDAIQEIVALRHTLRLLLRIQAEHPAPAVRANVAEILARINSAKKTLKLPMPQPLAAGPSFFYSARRFEPAALLRAADVGGDGAGDLDDDPYLSSSSSSSDDLSGGGGGRGGRGGRAYSGRRPAPHRRSSHALWVRRFLDSMADEWPNGTPHILALLSPLPQCGFALADTLGALARIRQSGVKEPDAHFLFAAGAAQAGCYPLVCFAEARVMAACYDDDDSGDVYETWLSRGLSAAAPAIQLLARLGHMLATCPWALTGADIRRLVDEYVRIHTEQQQQQQHALAPAGFAHARHRGDTAQPAGTPIRTGVHRSLSTSVVSGVAQPVLSGAARRALEESAVRDLLHTAVVMAVAHGLASFAQASGLTADLDHPAGSFFPQTDGFVSVDVSPGLSHVDLTRAAAAAAAATAAAAAGPVPAGLSAANLASRMGEHTFDLSVAALPLSADAASFRRAASASLLGLPPADPLTSRAPQFAAYRLMRERRLSRYDEPQPLHHPPLPLVLQHGQMAAAPDVDPALLGPDPGSPASASPLQIAHRIPRIALPFAPCDAAAATAQAGQPQAATPSHAPPSTLFPRPLQRPRPVHLSRSEHLQWDVISGYIRLQLALDSDFLGAEVQAARCLAGRPFFASLHESSGGGGGGGVGGGGVGGGSSSDDPGVFLANEYRGPVTAEPTEAEVEAEWSRPAGAPLSKSHSLASIPTLPGTAGFPRRGSSGGGGGGICGSSSSSSLARDLDVRQLHDAVWHFTLSLFHIYEELYFYTKFGGASAAAPGTAEFDALASEAPTSSAVSVPVCSPDAITADTAMDTDTDGDDSSGQSQSQNPSTGSQMYYRLLTPKLKDHIRAVALDPTAITAAGAQPASAAGLDLCIEEILHINLIVSLARRQAEITHAVRAIHEYQQLPHGQ